MSNNLHEEIERRLDEIESRLDDALRTLGIPTGTGVLLQEDQQQTYVLWTIFDRALLKVTLMTTIPINDVSSPRWAVIGTEWKATPLSSIKEVRGKVIPGDARTTFYDDQGVEVFETLDFKAPEVSLVRGRRDDIAGFAATLAKAWANVV